MKHLHDEPMIEAQRLINHPQWDKLEKSVKYLETIIKKGVKVDGNCKY